MRTTTIISSIAAIATLLGYCSLIAQQTRSTSTQQARRDFAATFTAIDNIDVAAQGQHAETFAMKSRQDGFVAAFVQSHDFPAFIHKLYGLGFTTFSCSDPAVSVTGNVTVAGLTNVKWVNSYGNQKLPPGQALAAASTELAKGDDGSPEAVYAFACQVPPGAAEYRDAQAIIRQNDIRVRKLGIMADFLGPLHEACENVSQGLTSPSALTALQPRHFASEELASLTGKARDQGLSVHFSQCGNLDDMVGICGMYSGELPAFVAFARSLFSDRELGVHLSALGYTAVILQNTAVPPSSDSVVMRRPTSDGWTLLQLVKPQSNVKSAPPAPELHLTKTFSNAKLNFPYPDSWTAPSHALDSMGALGPSSPHNTVQLPDGTKWPLVGLQYYSLSTSIVGTLHTYSHAVLQNMMKSDPRLKLAAATESRVGGHPAILVPYTTTSPVGDMHRWGLFAFFNSDKGVVVMNMFCREEDQGDGEALFNAILQHVTFN